jgi:hypothetical protein
MISGNGPMTITGQDGAVLVEAAPQGTDAWVYPRFQLPPGSRPPPDTIGLGCTLRLLEGDASFRAIFDEENGSGYVADLIPQPTFQQARDIVALFQNANHGAGWSKPDPNGHLDASAIVSFKIGCNPRSAKVSYAISNFRWLAP